MAENQYKILDNVKIPSVNEIVKLVLDNNIEDVYQYSVSYNAHNTGKIEQKELIEFIQNIYTDWYYNIRRADFKNLSDQAKKDFKRLLSYSKFYPSNMIGTRCLQFFYEEYEENFATNEIRPIFLSGIPNGETNTFIQLNGNIINGLKKVKTSRESKLYLNLKAKNILPFVKTLFSKLEDYDFDLDIKFSDMDNRSDNIIIYTTYKDTPAVVELIEEIKRNHSYLFDGTEKTGLFWGVINDYIGFGEEFKGDVNTYGTKRAKAIANCLEKSKVTYLKQIFLNQEKSVKVENGLDFTPMEFLDYLVKQICKLEIESRYEEMLNGERNEKEEEILKEIIDNVTAMENNMFQDSIDGEVKRLRECLINHKPFVLSLDLETEKAEVAVTSNYDFRGRLFDIFSTLNDKISISIFEKEKMDRIINMALYKNNCDIKLKTEDGEVLSPIKYLQNIIKTSAISSLKSYLFDAENKEDEVCAKVKEIIKDLEEHNEEGKAILKDTIFDFQNQLENDENIVLKLINNKEINIVLPYDYVGILVNVFDKSKTKFKDSVNEKTINKSLDKDEISVEKFIISKNTQEELKKTAN